MPQIHRPPAYRLHKARNCAVVTIDGRNHYLGPYGSPESHEKYSRLIAGWRSPTPHPPLSPPTVADDPGPSINNLVLDYFRHVQSYYVKDGQPTSEQDNIRQALRFVRQLYGSSPARDFGPMALKQVRKAMIDAGRSRKLINKDVNRIRQMFSYGRLLRHRRPLEPWRRYSHRSDRSVAVPATMPPLSHLVSARLPGLRDRGRGR